MKLVEEGLDDDAGDPVLVEDLLRALANECYVDSRRWFPRTIDSIPHHAMAMAGEMGELIEQVLKLFAGVGQVANTVKKAERGDKTFGDPVTKAAADEELVDVFIYLLNMAALMDVDLLKGYIDKRNKNNLRWSPDVV